MKARWNEMILAESDETLEVRGYHYFPRDAVRIDLLRAVEKTPHDLECPHGVQFFDVVDGPARAERAAWTYEAPQPALEAIRNWIGFWRDVALEP